MRFLAASVLLVALAAPLAAQSQVSDPGVSGQSQSNQTKFPLREIEIAGNNHFSDERIKDLLGLKVGDVVAESDFRRGFEHLNDAGVFESIEFRYVPQQGGYKVTYTVQEVAELYRFRADGFGVPAQEINDLLKEKIPLFGEMVPPTGTMVDRIGDELLAFWKARGNDSDVSGRLVSVGEDEFEMLFQPETAIETIAFVKFENTGVLSPLDLQRSFNQVAMGVPYSEKRLKELLHYNVRPLYEDKGRMEVEFCPCTAEPDEETKGLLVTVQVEQGDEYTFGEFELPRGLPIEPSKIGSLHEAESGEIAEMGKIRAGMSKIEDTFKRNGYMKAIARHVQELNRDENTVDVEVMVDPGALYEMGRLTITGLDVITEPAVRKRWGIKMGEPFDAGYPPYFLERIHEMFDNLAKTESEIRVDEASKTVDVELIFVGSGETAEPGELGISQP